MLHGNATRARVLDAVTALIDARQRPTVRAIGAMVGGLVPSAVKFHLDELIAEGLLTRGDQGAISLTPRALGTEKDISGRAQAYMTSEGWDRHIALARHPDPRIALAALLAIEDRAYGRAREHVTLESMGQTVVRFVIERPGGQPLALPPETIEGEAHEAPTPDGT